MWLILLTNIITKTFILFKTKMFLWPKVVSIEPWGDYVTQADCVLGVCQLRRGRGSRFVYRSYKFHLHSHIISQI